LMGRSRSESAWDMPKLRTSFEGKRVSAGSAGDRCVGPVENLEKNIACRPGRVAGSGRSGKRQRRIAVNRLWWNRSLTGNDGDLEYRIHIAL